MNNIISLKRGKWVAGLLAALVLTACSDWTEVEPVAINEADIAMQNPALYAGYLENLRSYKKSVHKVMITWFNNSNKVPLSRADHTDVLPDSIDIVSMMHPVNPAQYELDEMEKVRSEKGTKFVYDMNFEAIKLIYEEMVADMEDAAPEEGVAMAEIPAFVDFLVDTVNQILPLARKYSYDGIIIGYKGKNILHMDEAEKQLYTTYEKAFIGIAEDWHERNSDKMIIFEGYPQNLLNKSILEKSSYIIIPSTDAGNSAKLSYNIMAANVEGVPSDRYIISVETVSLDKEDVKTGYWADGVTRAVTGASQWVMLNHDDYSIAGLGIKNVNNDYFNIARIYRCTRDAISNMNPSPKK
ncbi:glycoside hydrolase family 18 [Proteiniphilum sp. UBA1028]|jgi:hypothetical protein|uniref:glycoside hydrolase family 18 n=1 Tax=Proteiniphilum sp. UBA1028 TaxID=1947251 RepID=UPI0025F60B1A|nr:glycoside hydrolase family 18 [Proteiniphilum sp. UBA1028]